MKKILIVGGVAGGASAAARLRRLDEHSEIIIFERGEHVSFANCGIPYYIGGVIKDKEDLLLQTPEGFRRRFNIDVRTLSEVLSINPEQKNVTVKNLVSGEIYCETYDKLILSPGAEPIRPPVSGIDSPYVFSIRTIADAAAIKSHVEKFRPKTAAIVGGGFIGVEMAENLSAAGLDVHIIELSEQVIAPLDIDMACDIHRYLRQRGVSLHLKNGLQKIEEQNGRLRLTLTNGALEADIAVLAIGVKPESGLAKEAGLELNSRGGIITDKHMRTSNPDIYAAGDATEATDFVTGQPVMVPLAGPANKQGRIAADNICGAALEYNGTQGSFAIKIFGMTAAATGVNEKIAKRLNLDYDKIFLWLQNHAAYYPDAKPISIKVIFEKQTGKILGAQLFGFGGADKRCDVFATAIRAGMNASGLSQLELCYAPPYSSAKDPVNMAGFVIENILAGRLAQFHWHDVDALPRDGSVILLDVRTARETANGCIGGFINIPLDDLRGRIGELDKTKPVYAHCQIGLRSYIAVRILMQNGFEAYSLSGGYRLYEAMKKNN
ncbi:MAG: FAD-dependent oxidoreductase [Defluviitaleaceae bacterium]|nr:FAD-dependent oxidoreductase [Defluviitaleaceae bacterium]